MVEPNRLLYPDYSGVRDFFAVHSVISMIFVNFVFANTLPKSVLLDKLIIFS